LNGRNVSETSEKFEGVTPTTAIDNDGLACNGKLTAVCWSSASSIAVFGTYDYKRFFQDHPLIRGH